MTTAPSSRLPFSERLGQSTSGRLDAISRSLSKSYSFHISSQPAQQQAVHDDDGLLRVDSVPIDFTLKTKIRISSPEPLIWLTTQDAKIMARSMQILIGQEELPSPELRSDGDMAALFRSCLLSWMHPDTCVEESSNERRALWEQSFHSLYYMVRQRVADYFYVVAAKFSLLFTSDVVVVSRSTSEIRKDLASNNVEFAMPLSEIRDEDNDEHFLLDVTEESALLIEGRRSLHRVFEYFINKKFLGDVPTIVSPVPFVNASIRPMTQIFCQTTSAPAKNPNSGGSKLVQTHVLEYAGSLLPVQIGRLAQIFRKRADIPVTIRLWTEPLTAAIDRVAGKALVEIAHKHGFVALLDFAKTRLESDATSTITTLQIGRTGRIAVEIEPAPKPSSLSRSLSITKLT